MKKIFVILVVLLSMSFYAKSQVNPHAIGLRFGGDGTYNGAEISYQHGIGSINRLEFDLGFAGYKHYNNIYLSLAYQWDLNIVGGLNWYIGPCAAIGFYNWDGYYYDDDDHRYYNNTGVTLGLGAQIGLEFDFNVLGAPILLSLDTRPMFDFFGYRHGFGWGAALGIRYTW